MGDWLSSKLNPLPQPQRSIINPSRGNGRWLRRKERDFEAVAGGLLKELGYD